MGEAFRARLVRTGDEPVAPAEPSFASQGEGTNLLIILPIEEPGDVERVTCAPARRFIFHLRLGCASRDVRHALEQGAALAARCRMSGAGFTRKPAPISPSSRFGLCRWLFGQHVTGAEQKFFTFLFRSRSRSRGWGRVI